ncbi:MAG TPA: hypothetical protein VK590_13435 [Saprospiraceae bacterium]|nr:hypothetical protein [Saprospiraceae bacterium]
MLRNLPFHKALISLSFALLFYSASCVAQDVSKYEALPQKGKFYVYWGWNRDFYAKSDIHFTGNNYDFTLLDVVGKDTQTPFSFDDYLNPFKATIPQTNFRLGYYFNEHYDISFGIDHMKYVMQQNQEVYVIGFINESGTKYDGVYDHKLLKLTPDFLRYEHTNGLTYVNVELRRTDKLVELGKLVHFNLDLNLIEGVSGGFLYPRTDATLLGNLRNNEFHVAGYGTALMLGLNIKFLKYFFIQTELKAGFINLPDVLTTNSNADRASQHFNFLQSNLLIGGSFSVFK